MKKLLIGILATGILFGAVGNSIAALKYDYARGKLVSIDYTKGEVVILEDSCQCKMTYIGGNIDGGLTEGIRVLVIYKPGTNQATRVKTTKK
jgi:hypothetical protein